jgi:hypothetical protein
MLGGFTAQLKAEPRATPDFIPNLQNSKNTHTKNAISFACEFRFLANLGFLKILEKVLQLYAEKHQEMSR